MTEEEYKNILAISSDLFKVKEELKTINGMKLIFDPNKLTFMTKHYEWEFSVTSLSKEAMQKILEITLKDLEYQVEKLENKLKALF